MALRFEPDVGLAEWWRKSSVPWDRLCTLGPDGFEAYAWVGLPGRPEDPSATDLRPVVDVLARHTTTPGDCFFALWDGYSDVTGGGRAMLAAGWSSRLRRAPREPSVLPAEVVRGPRVEIPYRTYLLFRGGSRDVGQWLPDGDEGTRHTLPGFSLMWPADRAWFAAADTDQDRVGVCGPEALVRDLAATEGLDVERTG